MQRLGAPAEADHILLSYALNGPRRGQALSGVDIHDLLEAETLAWVHLDADDPQSRLWIEDSLPYLDPHAVNALLAEETRPRATRIGDGVLMILRGVNLNEGAEPEDMVSIRLWVDAHRIISLQKRQLRAVLDIAGLIETGEGPDTAGAFAAMLIARLSERMDPVLTTLDDATDDLEEDVVARPDPDLRRPITEVRRQTIQLRRHIAPQRDAVHALRAAAMPWIDPLDERHLSEAQDRLTRTVETLDAIRERAQVVKDELGSALSDRLNRNLYILALVSAIFLPLGFLTGLMGINVGGLPGADAPQAFWIFCAVLGGVAGAILLLLRWRRWL